MATAPPDAGRRWAAWRLAGVRALAWTLLIGGWLSLGALGRLHTLRWAEGLLPLACMLLAVGLARHRAGLLRLPGMAVRATVAGAGLAAAAACLASGRGGGASAVFGAALCWGVLLVAASRGVHRLRSAHARPPSPVLPAAAGALAAWLWVGDPMSVSAMQVAAGVLLSSLLLAGLLPARAGPRECRSGLFDCALPFGGLPWREPAAWAAQASRWSMLPMMATLALMSPWCGDLGLSPRGAVALHLAAMFGPPLLLRPFRSSSDARTWATAALVLSPLLLGGLPGLRGLMALSLCQSLAWGLFWHARLAGAPAAILSPRPAPGGACLLPALAVAGIGCAASHAGPAALAAMLVALAALAAAGTAASHAASARRPLHQENPP